MAYKAENRSIGAFLNDNLLFQVPRYQRGYVWVEKNWEDIMRDIETGYKNEVDYKHFLGTFVFEDVIGPKEETLYKKIIDGQQRFITLQIIIFSIIYVLKKHIIHDKKLTQKEFSVIKDRIRYFEKFIIYSDDSEPEINKKQKLQIESDNFNKLASLSMEEIIKKSDVKIDGYESLSKDSISKSFEFITKYLESRIVDPKDVLNSIVEFQTALFNANIITVSSSNKQEVINLFEVLNARGLYLKQTELLKNYIFRNLTAGAIRDEVKIEWEKMNTAFYVNEVDSDDYLYHFMRAYYNIPGLKKEEVYQKLKAEEVKSNHIGVQKLYDSLKMYYNIYINISCNKDTTLEEARAYEYFILKQNKQIRSLFLALKSKLNQNVITEKSYSKYLNEILCFYIGFYFAKKQSNRTDTFISSAAYNVFNASTFADVNYYILQLFSKILTNYPSESMLKEHIASVHYSNKNRQGNIKSGLVAYYFKPFYEEAKIEKDVDIPYNKITIEHVVPDSSDNQVTWELGNLLLLTGRLNNTLKNSPYSVKKEKIKESDIRYNRLFVEQHDTFGEPEVKSRTRQIADGISQKFKLDQDMLKSDFKVESKINDVRKFIKERMKNEEVHVNKFNCSGVKAFSNYVAHNDKIDMEIKVDFLKIIE